MGQKGDKHTNLAQAKAEELVQKLAEINEVSSKKMFGGHGVFSEGKMFAMVNSKGEYYFKVNDELFSEFSSEGSEKHSKMPYASIPNHIESNVKKLNNWARKSADLAKS